MSSDECWVLGLSLCMFLNKSLATFISYVDCWVAFTLFTWILKLFFKLVFIHLLFKFIFRKSFSPFLKDCLYRHSWYQSLSLELELARIGSSDLGGLCVCEGPCRWISESVWFFLLLLWFLFTIDWLYCSELASWLLLIDCCFVIVWLLFCYWLACLCG